jgi:hypothetical protein
MSKILLSAAACALLAMAVLPGTANAAERRADGVRTAEVTTLAEFSARKRRYSRRHVTVRRAWRPRYGFVAPRYGWNPGYRYWGRTHWRPRYAWGSPYYWHRPYRYGYWGAPFGAYAAHPFYYNSWRARPSFGFSIGFGPSWW